MDANSFYSMTQKILTSLEKAVAALPCFFEASADLLALGLGAFGVFDEARGLGLGEFKQGAVTDKVRDAKVGKSGLACSEDFAGATELEIELGKFKSVLRADHGRQALLGGR